VFEIKTLIAHPMESGQRKDAQGKTIPRMIISRFVCRYNGEDVFSADWAPAVAANPYLSFFTVATASGKMEFEWLDDAGKQYAYAADIKVE
jgi:sulfur-oxidizing protein SoxZ